MSKRSLPIITTSEIQTFQRCQRLHHYRYTLGYRPIERAHALDFGTLIHAGLETWWKTAGDIVAACATMREAFACAEAGSPLDSYDLTRATVMLEGYHARWVDEPITVLAVEKEFRVPIRHPDGRVHRLELAGKFDAECEIDGRVFIPEHKSKSERVDSAKYFAALVGNLQVSNYLIAATEQGREPGGALYDVLVKLPEPKRATPVESRKYTKSGELYSKQRAEDEDLEAYRERLTELVCATPDDYYQRAVVTRLEHEIDEAKRDLWAMADALADVSEYAPRTPGACSAFGRVCEFHPVCFEGGSLEDSAMYERLESPHQELSHATSNAAAE